MINILSILMAILTGCLVGNGIGKIQFDKDLSEKWLGVLYVVVGFVYFGFSIYITGE